MLIADVAVPVPLAHSFSYEVPALWENRVSPGVRVLCPFGPRKTLGVVLGLSGAEPGFDRSKLRALSAIVDEEPVLGPELLAFLKELSAYYLAPIGEVLRMALPALERTQVRALSELDPSGKSLKGRTVGSRAITMVHLVAPAVTSEGCPPDSAASEQSADVPGRAVPQLRGRPREILEHLRACPVISLLDLEQRCAGARAAVKRLAALGLVELRRQEVPAGPFFALPVARDAPPALTPSQERATATLREAIGAGRAQSFLLFGVTGSGKTEIYLRAIAASLEAGKGALVLVPEIALTPQLVGRFRARFGDDVAVIHSGLKEKERHLMWRRLRSGAVQVAIGARSALFAPVQKLGLVVVDEEHDPSFKQEEGARYHARDMAILRAHRAGAIAVLGSATPSLETEVLCRLGKLKKLELPERAHAAAILPKIELVDLKRIGPGPSGHPLLSLPLHRAIDKTLAAHEQVILFLNRRGFAPSVICAGCGTIVRCKLCSVALTYHRVKGGTLLCHYCDYSAPLPDACPDCSAKRLELEGLGTEKLELAVVAAFPQANVARLDRDVAAGTKAEAVLDRVRSGEVDILVGTQMVTKGHDLPRVTLVGVINADAALSMPDYRAAERAFQILVQVAGRAGRSDRPGTVIIQTRDPENPAIVFASRHDVPGFLAREIADREELDYPPFARWAMIRIDGADEERTRAASLRLAQAASRTPAVAAGEVEVRGPRPAPLARLQGRYRFQVLLRAKERRPLRASLLAILPMRDRLGAGIRMVIDVDPVKMM
jgi:primosomal protein N' (replication factor Y) (superfamily II helicase)